MDGDADIFSFVALSAIYVAGFVVLGHRRPAPRLHLRLGRRSYGRAFAASAIGLASWWPLGTLMLLALALNVTSHYLEVPARTSGNGAERRMRRARGERLAMEELRARLRGRGETTAAGPVIEGECVRLD
jgi:hypothetical protein